MKEKKCSPRMFRIAAGERPRVLLMGNGPCRAYNGFSWDKLLDGLKDPAKYSEDAWRYDMPMPLKAAMLGGDTLAGSIRAAVTSPKKSPDGICWDGFAQCGPDLANCLRRLAGLGFDSILTTNYGYELEAALLGQAPNKPLTPQEVKAMGCFTEGDKRQIRYLLNTFDRVTRDGRDYDIWHIHGEARLPDSMIIGHNDYVRLLSRLVERASGSKLYTDINSAIGRGEPVPVASWVDAFILGDVYILGFGLDFSETDLWWLIDQKRLLSQKPGWERFCGSTTYFANQVGTAVPTPGEKPCPLSPETACATAAGCMTRDECRRLLLEAKGVTWVPLKADDYPKCYDEAYRLLGKKFGGK